MADQLVPLSPHRLTSAPFQALSDIPPEAEWFANLRNRHTRENYERDIRQFIAFAGLGSVDQLREVTRPHVLAWRDHLHGQGLANDTIRRKLAALSSLYDYLCNRHAVLHNPVLGVRRPASMNREGATRRCFCWRPRRPERSKASATGRCWPCSSIMASGGRSSAG